jgi:predicted NACHT family NTPase
LLIVTLFISAVLTVYGAVRPSLERGDPKTSVEDFECYAEQLRESLTDLYQQRYEQKLDSRIEIALEVRRDWSKGKVELIKDRFDHTKSVGSAVQVVSGLLAERGRLLIVGSPGAGKTVLLLKLAIALLEKASQASSESFPLIFNLASWSSDYSKFDDWLKGALQSGYGLSEDFANTLLSRRKIILLLDGLDELALREDERIAAQKRADCMRSLNRAL